MTAITDHDFVKLPCCGSTFFKDELHRAGLVSGVRDYICPTCESRSYERIMDVTLRALEGGSP